MRLDMWLVAQGMAASRARAQQLIAAGSVAVNGAAATKAAVKVSAADKVTLLENDHPYASRGALKLAALVEATAFSFQGKTVLDIGASTGGFTDYALQHGAVHVSAVEVGQGQLAAKLCGHKRITLLEKCDARTLSAGSLPQAPQVLLADVSFISLTKVLPHVLQTFSSLHDALLLIKPQFELTPQDIGKGGIVRSAAAHGRACSAVQDCLTANGWKVVHLMPCPLTGTDGNQEFLCAATKEQAS